MNLWEKVKKGLEGGAATVSEKASDWFKIGAEYLKEGAEKVSEKALEVSKLARLKWEQRSIQKDIEQELIEIGGKLYDLWSQDRVDELRDQVQENVARIQALEKELENKEKEIEELSRSIDKVSISELKKDLEAGGGTIEQIVIKTGSPVLGKKLREVELPKEALVGTIVRGPDVIIPDGETEFQEGDKVTLLGKKEDVEKAVSQLT
ncbi:MAG: TrkA C-terminal domain-containing protein [candidate division KSB1 bacterium]|nr:TrkA C-terminal domain-containing protein [candidate division KSB1 bacterium]